MQNTSFENWCEKTTNTERCEFFRTTANCRTHKQTVSRSRNTAQYLKYHWSCSSCWPLVVWQRAHHPAASLNTHTVMSWVIRTTIRVFKIYIYIFISSIKEKKGLSKSHICKASLVLLWVPWLHPDLHFFSQEAEGDAYPEAQKLLLGRIPYRRPQADTAQSSQARQVELPAPSKPALWIYGSL